MRLRSPGSNIVAPLGFDNPNLYSSCNQPLLLSNQIFNDHDLTDFEIVNQNNKIIKKNFKNTNKFFNSINHFNNFNRTKTDNNGTNCNNFNGTFEAKFSNNGCN